MRILIVIHGYPPTHVGGAELRAERTARAFAARGHDVAVLCIEQLSAAGAPLMSGAELQDGVQVYRIHGVSAAALIEARAGEGEPPVSRCLSQLITTWRPDLVHLFSGYLMGSQVIETAKALGTPVIVALTDYWWICHRINLVRTNGARCEGPTPLGCVRCQREIYRRYRLPSNMMRPLTGGLWHLAGQIPALRDHLGLDEQATHQQKLIDTLNHADALIAPSRFLADMYVRHGVRAHLLRVWRQGVSLSCCPLRAPSPTLRFGYMGQIKHHKGVHTLIEAWGRLRRDRARSLSIYGSSYGEEAYSARLQQRARRLEGITWGITGSHAEIWDVLANLDVLVITSRWYENSPNVILEAQAMGIPVIGTNLGGIAELVQHGRNGLLFEPDDAADLAAQMTRLLDEPGLLSALRQHPIAFHSFNDELDRLLALYEQLGRPGRSGAAEPDMLPILPAAEPR